MTVSSSRIFFSCMCIGYLARRSGRVDMGSFRTVGSMEDSDGHLCANILKLFPTSPHRDVIVLIRGSPIAANVFSEGRSASVCK
jgi:predicted permease